MENIARIMWETNKKHGILLSVEFSPEIHKGQPWKAYGDSKNFGSIAYGRTPDSALRKVIKALLRHESEAKK